MAALALMAVVVVGAGSIAASALAGDSADVEDSPSAQGVPLATALPVPQQIDGSAPAADEPGDAGDTAPSTATVCDDPAVTAALASGTDSDVIAAVGGGAAFRAAVAAGEAPCLDLSDSARVWVVANKERPLVPVDYAPAPITTPDIVATTANLRLRVDVADALTRLAAAAADEGAGRLGLNSAYRSYDSQVRIHNGYVRQLGQEGADQTSARPGHSEHQTGLAADVVACTPGCGTLPGFGGTVQADWVADNAWRFGFIVRYEDGHTDTTGYEWEPWHLRYLGPELAQAYHEGAFHTLEEFFGLPAAPHYD